MKQPLEKYLETQIRLYAESRGCLCLKFVSPSMAGVSDRVILTKHGVAGFLEVKSRGGTPTALQARFLGIMRDRGFKADWANSLTKGQQFVDELLKLKSPTDVDPLLH